MDPSSEDRLVEVEMKLAFQERAIEDLSAALIDKEKRISELEDSVKKLERALQILAQRRNEEVLGANPEDDPVPRSG
jgi:uncharacterized coiled-coil protein SlyX